MAFLMMYNVFQQARMLPTVTRNVTFACTGVARREVAGGTREKASGGRGGEGGMGRKMGEMEEMGRGGSRMGRDGSRTRCSANIIKIDPVFCLLASN